MNKLFAVSFLAFAYCLVVVRAEEPLASDAQEVAQLGDKGALFGDFCLAIRDYVTDDLRSKGMSLVPTTVLDLLHDTANRHRDVRTRLEQLMENPAGELKKLDNFVAEQQQALGQTLQERSFEASGVYNRARDAHYKAKEQLRNFFKNPHAHLEKVDGFVAQQQRALGQRLQHTPLQPGAFIKSAYDSLRSMADRIRNAPLTLAKETCKAFALYEQEIAKRFEAAKTELAAKDASVAGMKLDELPCSTIARIQSVRKACDDIKSDEQTFTW